MDKKEIYLNSAYYGKQPTTILKQILKRQEKWNRQPSQMPNIRLKVLQNAKKSIASLCHTTAQHIALIANFTVGISLLTEQINAPKKVLMYANDYPSLTNAFKHKKFNCISMPQNNIEVLTKYVRKHKPDIVALSITHYMSGYTYNLKTLDALSKKHQCMLVLDATQCAGILPMNLSVHQNIDAVLTSGYKWLLGGYGNGFLYLSKKMQQKYFPQKDFLAKMELGNLNTAAFLNLDLGIQFLLKQKGKKRLTSTRKKILYLINKLKEKNIAPIESYDSKRALNLCSFKGTSQLFKRLKKHHIDCTYRNGLIRISVYFYTTKKEIEAFLSLI